MYLFLIPGWSAPRSVGGLEDGGWRRSHEAARRPRRCGLAHPTAAAGQRGSQKVRLKHISLIGWRAPHRYFKFPLWNVVENRRIPLSFFFVQLSFCFFVTNWPRHLPNHHPGVTLRIAFGRLHKCSVLAPAWPSHPILFTFHVVNIWVPSPGAPTWLRFTVFWHLTFSPHEQHIPVFETGLWLILKYRDPNRSIAGLNLGDSNNYDSEIWK